MIKTTGVGAGVALGAGAASGDETVASSDSVEATQEAVSTFTATATNASLAIDVDDPTDESNRIQLDTGSPLLELSGNEQREISDPGINEYGTLMASPDQIDVPDLVEVILGLNPTATIVDIIEGIDIQQDIIDALDLQTDVVDPLVDFINQLELSETQASAIGQLIDILDQEFGFIPPVIGDLIDVQDFFTGLLLNPGSQIAGIPFLLTLLGIEDMQDLVDTVISFIDGVNTVSGLKQFIIDQVQAFDLAGSLEPVSLETELNGIEGEVDPNADVVDLLMSFPLETASITPSIDLPDTSQDLPPVDFALGIDLTTGESGALTGGFSENADSPDLDPTGTVVNNQFTADITEFDLLGIVNELDFVAILEFVFNSLGIDPGQYPDFTIQEFVDDADIPSIIENAELLQLLDDQITDQPGRHLVTADVEFNFEDLDAVRDITLGPPPLPGIDSRPQDLNVTSGGTFEDVDGTGEFTIFDVQLFFLNFSSDPVQNNPEAFKFSDPDAENPDDVTIFDVQALFLKLAAQS
ncbi:MAG: hypothetical protein J07HX64_01507 [halophilic archaeon J07HX64]|nr:MAG: hypothetical protein J07HX64_01507 [halophilic archaeon J07HX64]